VQYRTFDSNKSTLQCDEFTDAHNVHLAMTKHKEFSADSGFNSYYQISYKTLELHISSYKSSFTDIMETRYSRTHLFAIMFF
jgi:hypothetical protein